MALYQEGRPPSPARGSDNRREACGIGDRSSDICGRFSGVLLCPSCLSALAGCFASCENGHHVVAEAATYWPTSSCAGFRSPIASAVQFAREPLERAPGSMIVAASRLVSDAGGWLGCQVISSAGADGGAYPFRHDGSTLYGGG